MNSLIKLSSGRIADLPANIQDGMWLPADTPFGNLQLKYVKALTRLGHANARLASAYSHWHEFRSPALPIGIDHGSLAQFDTEDAIGSMRRAADELLALESVLAIRLETGTYPSKVKADSIGRSKPETSVIYAAHKDFLLQLNEISNAHKHSFLQSSVNGFGAEEPGVIAYPLSQNNLEADSGPYMLRLGDVVESFSAFFATAHAEIHKLASQLGP